MTKFSLSFCLALPIAMLSASLAHSQAGTGRIYARVEVRGAEFIPEDDIRMTCGELEGIELDDIQLRSVEDCLMSTGVFESVTVAGKGDILVIEVSEVESRPGRVDVGLAWGNDYGLSGTLSYEQFNLIPDTFLGIQSSYSHDYRSYTLNLYRKEAFGPALHFGLDIAGERTDFEDLSFSTHKDLAEAYVAWTPQPETRLEFGLGYRELLLFDLDPEASPLLQAEAGTTSAPFLHFVFDYGQGSDQDPRSYLVRLDQYLWNIGSDSAVSETRIEARSRFALGERSALVLGLRGGLVSGRNGYEATVLDRTFVGGETFRGFAPRGLGPVDSGDQLGGNRHLVGSVEMQRALGTASENPVLGGVFMDFGSVWSLDNTLGGTIDDSAHFRSSLGFSLTFGVAQIPVSVYLATPVRRQPGDEKQVFGLSATARF